MIFGTLDFPISSNENIVHGAWIASKEFYRALIRHGNFDEYHFFVATTALDDLKPPHYLNKRTVKFKEIEKLPFYFQNTEYSIFFTSSPSLSQLSTMRSQHAQKFFPICGLTHTISYSDVLNNTILHNLISNIFPFDSIICTSTPCLRAFHKLNGFVIRALLKERKLLLEYKGRLDHLPLGIDPEPYMNIDSAEARDKLGLPKDKIIIIYFGRFSIYDKMDLDPLLLSFKNIISQNKNIFLIMAGGNML